MQQPATICSEKGKPVLPGKTRVFPSLMKISRFWKGRVGYVYIYIYIYIYTYSYIQLYIYIY